jgi:RTX calcium-binding nonapeptide repeat (4 copies)
MRRLVGLGAILCMLLASLAVLPSDAQAAVPKCFGERATIVGTSRSDKLVGTRRADVIVGLGGKDTIFGKGGNDRICGGRAGNTIHGGLGSDRISGGAGKDVLVAGSTGDDLMTPGDNWLKGGTGGDVLVGGPAADRLEGGPGIDIILGAGGKDRYVGGSGTDIAAFLASPRGVNVDLAAGTARGDGSDTLIGIEAVLGSAHDDGISGDSAMNFFWGWDGNDRLDGRGGSDFVVYSESSSGVVVNLTNGIATGEGTDVVVSIENAHGSNQDDTLIGTPRNNYLDGAGGKDLIDGGGGNDVCKGEGTNCAKDFGGAASEVSDDAPPSALAGASLREELPSTRESPPPLPAGAQDIEAAAPKAAAVALDTGSLVSGFGPSNYGVGGCYAFYPTGNYGYGRLHTRARWMNGSVWSNWSVHEWTWVGQIGISLVRLRFDSRTGQWVNAPYQTHTFVTSSPGTVIESWWENWTLGQGGYQLPGVCGVDPSNVWVLSPASLGSALPIRL